MKNIGILLSGGVGSRLGDDNPKQFLKFAGLTCLEHSFLAFNNNNKIDEIIIVSVLSHIEKTQSLLATHNPLKPYQVITGGANRNQSTYRALQHLNSDCEVNLVIHDAVRPLVSNRIINDCILSLNDYSAVDVAIPAVDTIIKKQEHNDCIETIPNRNLLMYGQTPQAFKYSKLKSAYSLAYDEDSSLDKFSDDCGVFMKYAPTEKIHIVQGDVFNKKLTTIEDLPVIDRLFQLKRLSFNKKQSHAQLNNKVVVVFGGSSGIGKSIIEELSENNSTHSFSTRNNCDITNLSDIKNALNSVFLSKGRIDFVINTAGILKCNHLIALSPEDITHLIDVNYKGAVNIAQLSHQYLKESKGMLIFTSSSSYTRGRENYAIYSSSKAAIVNLTQALASEWSNEHIKVNCIVPARTKTPMREKAFGKEPGGNLLSPAAIATQVKHIMTTHISGEILDIN